MTIKGAGSLRERVTFQRRTEIPDGYGNPIAGEWTDQFSVSAGLTPRLGSEDVVASRMAGVQPYILRVRMSSQTRMVTPGWRAFDARKGMGDGGEPVRSFEILSAANVDEKGQYLDFLVKEFV